jgi:Tol biopolymer transport system component
LAWAADGKGIVFAEPPLGLWRVAASGGEPYRLNIGVRPHSVSISRRGSRLVYSEAEPVNVNIWRTAGPNATGRASSGSAASPSRFISSTALDYSPRYSPDGAKTAFFSEREGGRRLWLSDSEGSKLLRLAGPKEWAEGWCANPRWSPDGRYIAFDSNSEGNHDIYVVRAAGGAPRRITFDPAADECPSWSNDGRWIYFGSTRSGEFEIWKMPAEGGTAEQVTRKGGKEPFGSADGRFIYYTRRWPILGIWRVPVTGGEETRVLDEGSEAMWDLHRDGILFRAGRPEDGPTIEFYRFATSRVELIKKLPEGTLTHHGLNVSPDGRWVLYAQVDRRESDIMLVENFPR